MSIIFDKELVRDVKRGQPIIASFDGYKNLDDYLTRMNDDHFEWLKENEAFSHRHYAYIICVIDLRLQFAEVLFRSAYKRLSIEKISSIRAHFPFGHALFVINGNCTFNPNKSKIPSYTSF